MGRDVALNTGADFGGIARQLESITMESDDDRGFGKDVSVTSMDGGGIDLSSRVPPVPGTSSNRAT
jgi:hypothetical protein